LQELEAQKIFSSAYVIRCQPASVCRSVRKHGTNRNYYQAQIRPGMYTSMYTFKGIDRRWKWMMMAPLDILITIIMCSYNIYVKRTCSFLNLAS